MKELERQGVENHVVTFNRKNAETRSFPRVELVERPSRWHPRRLWHRSLVPFGMGESRTSDWPLIRNRLLSKVRAINPDVIHAHFGPTGVLIAPVAKAAQVPLVVSFHGFDAFQLPNEEFWRSKYKTLFEGVSRVTVVSDVMYDHLVSIGAPSEKVEVVHVGKRMDDYPFRKPSSPVRRWISVGRLAEKKGYGDCIAAFRKHVEKFPDSTLDIIGDGEKRAELEKQILNKNLEGKARLHGRRPHEEVKAYMRDADGFVLCSKEAEDGNREGIPTVLMEAQAIGLPVVATHHSGIPEVIPEEQHDLLAPEGNTDIIAARLNTVASQTVNELTQIAERGRQKMKREFSLSSEVKALRDTYHTSE
ncbi:glycosyltransferase involved in cell wall biosynthesis [Salinibacter ruber]|nr:glycosyltransferase involved in cell wall biosynthesis [Salinibacter ruber]